MKKFLCVSLALFMAMSQTTSVAVAAQVETSFDSQEVAVTQETTDFSEAPDSQETVDVPAPYVYATDSYGCRINGFYNEEDKKYYMFVTSSVELETLDITYLAKSDEYENVYDEVTIEDAFASSMEISVDTGISASNPDGTDSNPDGTASNPDGTASNPDGTASNPNVADSNTDSTDSSATIKMQIVAMQSSLPSLYISLTDTNLETIHENKSEKYQNNKVVLEDPSGKYDLNLGKVEVKGRGNTSWSFYEKKSYQIKFDKKTSVLGMPKAKKWILLANSGDASMVKNSLAFSIGNKLEIAGTPEGEYVDLWIDGDYRGTYFICEKVEIDSNRLNLTDDNGVIIENDNAFYRYEDYTFYNEYLNKHCVVKDSVNEEPDVINSNMEKLNDYLDDFFIFLNTTPHENITLEKLGEYIDVDSFAKFYLVNEYLYNTESTYTSGFWYKDGDDDVIHYGPLWDFDSSMSAKGPADSYYFYREALLYELLSIPAFYDRTAEIYDTYSNDFENIETLAETTCSIISESANMNYTRWKILGTKDRKGISYPATYEDATSEVTNWLNTRYSLFAPYRTIGITYTPIRSGANSDNSDVYDKVLVTINTPLIPTVLNAAVWSDENSQDDLSVLTFTNTANNEYTATFDLYRLKHTGKIILHLSSDISPKIASAFYVDTLPPRDIITTSVADDCSTLTITLNHPNNGYDAVYFPVWSDANGRDDIVWYRAAKDSSGNWTATVDLTAHKTAGKYIVHVYSQTNGAMSLIGAAYPYVKSVYIPSPKLSTVLANDCSTLKISLANANDYDAIFFPTWSSVNGQDDIVWYPANKTAIGTWEYMVDLTKHNSSGIYNIHAYGVKNGKLQLLTNTSFNVPVICKPRPIVTTAVSADSKTLTIRVSNASSYSNILLPVWSAENDKDDLVWYTATKSPSGDYVCNVDLSKHKGKGTYYIHVYSRVNNSYTAITAAETVVY